MLTLAIGIGANTAVFSVVNSVLLNPLRYPKSEELVAVRQLAPGAAGLANFIDGLHLSPSMYFTYAEQNRTFQSLGVWISGTANVTGLAEPEQVRTVLVSNGVLQTLSVPPEAGRSFSARRFHSNWTTRLVRLGVFDNRDAQLRILAAAIRGRSIRGRTQHHD